MITLKDVVGSSGGWSAKDGWRYTLTAYLDADKGERPGPRAALQATGLEYNSTYKFPLTGTPTETDTSSFLQSIDVQADGEDGRRYKVTIQYAPYDIQQDKGPTDEEGKPDPFSAPPVLRCRGSSEEVAAMYSRSGNPILNTAGDPLPGLTFAANIIEFSVSRLERYFPRTLITTMQNRVNDGVFQDFPAESLLCTNITATRTWNQDVNGWAWECEYEFAYKEPVAFDDVEIIPGWAATVLNAGTRQKVGSDRKQIIIDGAPVSEPVPLKEDGTVASPTDDPYYLAFDVYPTASFDAFGFPSDLFSAGTPPPGGP